jgi:hypothetical protein
VKAKVKIQKAKVKTNVMKAYSHPPSLEDAGRAIWNEEGRE